MSPAVSTATATAAAAMAPRLRRKVTLPADPQRGHVELGGLLQLALDRAEPDPREEDDPGQAGQGVDDRRTGPADQDRPQADGLHPSRVPEGTEPGRRVQRQGDEQPRSPGPPAGAVRPQRSVRNRSRARRIPAGRARASVSITSVRVSTASRAGRRSPAGPAREAAARSRPGRCAPPVAGSGSSRQVRRIAPAQRSSPSEASARSSFRGTWAASITVAASGQPTSTASAPRMRQPGEPGTAAGHALSPAARISAAVLSYASATHSTM